TLKGDSAACGFEELSSLAHQLEDVLTPELAASTKGKLVEAVLTCADIFAALLTCYREGTQPPTSATVRAIAAVRDQIRELVATPEPRHIVPYKLTGRFAWTEYEQI